MIFPTIHLNGTSAQELLDPIELAMASLQTALCDLQKTAPNARDYYPQGDRAFPTAVAEHERRLRAITAVVTELGGIYSNIESQKEARKR